MNIEKLINRMPKFNQAPTLVIDLPSAVVIQHIPAQDITMSKVEIYEVVDNNINKTVIAKLTKRPFEVVLWEKEAYDTIGQWTDDDVKNRILEIYKK